MSDAAASPLASTTVDMTRGSRMPRLVLLGLGALGMIAGLVGGLVRLGWTLPQADSLAAIHGPLMVSGAFGTLISLERAVALGQRWSYAAPLLAGCGSLALLAGLPIGIGAGLYVLASAVLVAASLDVAYRQPALFTATMLGGALAWFSGNLLWFLDYSMADVVGWWLAFFVFTIGGERLDLSRLMERKRSSEWLFLIAAALVAAGALGGILTPTGAVLFGLGLIATTAWLVRHDIAVRMVRRDGQVRFFAAAMLGGYAWLAIAGAVAIVHAPHATTHGYDLALHAVLVGFVLSMVFGHALIILPAVARLRLRYHPFLYGPLLLLHLSLLVRAAGDLLEIEELRLASGPLTIAALAAFAACVVYAARRSTTAGRQAATC